jgi:rare lipoprotein A
VRTSPIVATSALIAVVALVATAGTGRSEPPGTIERVDSGAFVRLVPPPLDAATTTPTLDPLAGAEALQVADELVDPGAPSVPTARPVPAQPRPPAGVVVKPTPPPPPPRSAPRATSAGSGSGWRSAEYSWYGPGFYGSGTACGQTLSKSLLGVAHKTLPCGTRVTFRNPKNGRTITVSVIDRGPYVAGRMWDLSSATCSYLGNCYTSTIQYRIH